MPTSTAVLILAAHEPELQPLRARLVRARFEHVTCRAVGVGMVAAAAGSATLLAQVETRIVLLTGSAGLYPRAGALRPAEVVVGREVRLLDGACLQGQAALPGPIPYELTSDEASRDELLRAGASRTVAIGTTLGITTDDGVAALLGRQGRCEAETLEAYGVAQACAQAQVPLAVLLGITNLVGSQGRSQWLAHRTAAAEACADVIVRWLTARAQ